MRKMGKYFKMLAFFGGSVNAYGRPHTASLATGEIDYQSLSRFMV